MGEIKRVRTQDKKEYLLSIYFWFLFQDSLFLVLSISIIHHVNSFGLLGAGEGRGSCLAPPYRAPSVQWPGGCPVSAPCCNEYGYCVTEEAWLSGRWRDCNGQTNGQNLPDDVIKLEAIFAVLKSSPLMLGPIGPIVIGNNGPIGGSGGSAGSFGNVDNKIDNRLEMEKINVSEDFEDTVVSGGGNGGSGGSGGSGGGMGGSGGDGGTGGGNGGDGGDGGAGVGSGGNEGSGGSGQAIGGGYGGSGGGNGGSGGDGGDGGPRGGNGGDGGDGGAGGGSGGNGGSGGSGEAIDGGDVKDNEVHQRLEKRPKVTFNRPVVLKRKAKLVGRGIAVKSPKGYRNRGRYPAGLNEENCPNFPFCQWVP